MDIVVFCRKLRWTDVYIHILLQVMSASSSLQEISSTSFFIIVCVCVRVRVC